MEKDCININLLGPGVLYCATEQRWQGDGGVNAVLNKTQEACHASQET